MGHLALVSQTLRMPFYPKERRLFQTLIYIYIYRSIMMHVTLFRYFVVDSLLIVHGNLDPSKLVKYQKKARDSVILIASTAIKPDEILQ